MNEKIGFVILHYNTEIETKNCTLSILEHVPGASIVIVDNGSPNQSGENLLKYFENSTVNVLILEKNIGFARGNNEGINFLKRHSNSEYIILLNNDTLILQSDFCDLIEQEYKKSHFAVMGPHITTKNGDTRTNPVEFVADSKKKINKLILKRQIKLLLNELHLDCVLNSAGSNTKHTDKYNPNNRYQNVKLHGCCWILSPVFFENFNGLYDKTFLYFEEDILYLQLMERGLLTIYNPMLKIIHLEDSSTNSIVQSNRKKNIFVLKNELQSLKVLRTILTK